jgi:hypothetical protein
MKITRRQLKQIIKEEITRVDEDRTSDSIGLERAIDSSKESLRPKILEIMKSTYIGGYAADGALSLWDTIESVRRGAGEETLKSFVLQLANMQQYK